MRLSEEFECLVNDVMLNDVISEGDAALLHGEIARQEFPMLFATISGAHLYGFASNDSDFDVRGVHVLPLRDVVGLYEGRETIESNAVRDGRELDVVTHDAAKFFGLLLKKNGYVLEQLLSPLVLHTTPEHDELKAIAGGLIRVITVIIISVSRTRNGSCLRKKPCHVSSLCFTCFACFSQAST